MIDTNSGEFEFVEESGQVVKADRHINPDGTLGGWVAVTATVHKNAYVEMGALVPPGAHVTSGERVCAEVVLAIEPF